MTDGEQGVKDKLRTELEGCVLGLVAERGPCTGYAIRREFAQSPSWYWSGSAGAVYPVIRRLVERRLIHAEAARGRRGRGARNLSITDAGREALRRWIGPPVSAWAASATFDPVRTRLTFFGALPPARRERFVSSAIEATRKALADLERLADEEEGRHSGSGAYWNVRAGIHELRARLDCLEEIHAALEERSGGER